MGLGKNGQILPRLKTNPVIIHSKVSGVWMGDVYGDQRNPCSGDFVGDGRRDSLINLKFDHQVNLLPDKFFRIAHCYLRIIVVVQDQQIHSRRIRRRLQTFSHSFGERHLRRFASEAKADFPRSGNHPIQAIL